jgi:hypothetical protein
MGKKAPNLLKRKMQRNDYYRKLGYTIEEIWECNFMEMIKENRDLQDFIQDKRPKFFKSNKSSLSQDEILEGVKDASLFGILEVDIATPEKWEGNFKPDLPPAEYFGEMSPIFCTTEIPFSAIGPHMQQHAIKHNLSEKPRKLLVGGMKAEKIMLATPLLKWYLEHGMLVTHIYQVVEFQSMKCFQNFVKDVTDARRAGDSDPDKSIMADLSKLIGNSGYGSTLMNKLNHTNISYCGSENEACLKANDPKFKSLTQLHPDYAYFEVESMKKKIVLDIYMYTNSNWVLYITICQTKNA